MPPWKGNTVTLAASVGGVLVFDDLRKRRRCRRQPGRRPYGARAHHAHGAHDQTSTLMRGPACNCGRRFQAGGGGDGGGTRLLKICVYPSNPRARTLGSRLESLGNRRVRNRDGARRRQVSLWVRGRREQRPCHGPCQAPIPETRSALPTRSSSRVTAVRSSRTFHDMSSSGAPRIRFSLRS